MIQYRFAGGRSDGGIAPNITPDPSGIGYYDEALFIQTMRTGKVGGVRELREGMPWRYIRNLTDDDLRAMFSYLQTLPAIQHRVTTYDEETLCPVCGQKHGLGSLNLAPSPAQMH